MFFFFFTDLWEVLQVKATYFPAILGDMTLKTGKNWFKQIMSLVYCIFVLVDVSIQYDSLGAEGGICYTIHWCNVTISYWDLNNLWKMFYFLKPQDKK